MIQLFHGNCLEILPTLPENSVDSIVTDPPYGLEFMGKDWDAPWKTDRRQVFNGTLKDDRKTPFTRSKVRNGSGASYGANAEVMAAFQEWLRQIAVECLRVLKPGGHLLAFGGSRTYHRLACAVEDAGFEIRDQIMWLYASGFPKSLNVSKAVDKAGGRAQNWFGPWLRAERERINMTAVELARLGGFFKNVNHGGLVVNWELGYGVPTASEFNKVCEILNLPFERLEEVEREVIGQRKVNRGVAFSSDGPDHLDITLPATDAAKQWDGWGTALKPAHEPIVVARKPLIGTVVANVLEYGTGALNIDGCRVGENKNVPASVSRTAGRVLSGSADGTLRNETGLESGHNPNVGRWPANIIHDGSEEVLVHFPDALGQQGDLVNHDKDRESPNGCFGKMAPAKDHAARRDSGSAARFFYCAKASKKDRGEENKHPTVKPQALMRYLVRLVTPPKGVVLDPFAGSFSTGLAAKEEGFSFIGVEKEEEYYEYGKKRMGETETMIDWLEELEVGTK